MPICECCGNNKLLHGDIDPVTKTFINAFYQCHDVSPSRAMGAESIPAILEEYHKSALWKERALKAEAQNEKLKAAVRLAGNTFRSYEAIHKNKVNESRRNSLDADLTMDEIKSLEKAKRNKNLADAMHQTLKENDS